MTRDQLTYVMRPFWRKFPADDDARNDYENALFDEVRGRSHRELGRLVLWISRKWQGGKPNAHRLARMMRRTTTYARPTGRLTDEQNAQIRRSIDLFEKRAKERSLQTMNDGGR